MTNLGSLSSRLRPAQPCRLNIVLRDSMVIEGYIHIGEDQSLVQYFSSRRGGWMNVTRARRTRTDDAPGHIIVQSEHVVMASAPDGGVMVTSAPGAEERPVEVVLVGGHTIRGHLPAGPKQRLSDVIAAYGKFIGITRATLSDGRALGDLALNAGAIALLRDLRDAAPIDEGLSGPEL